MFRSLLHVGEAARAAGSGREHVDLVGCLKEILQAEGITLLEEDEGDGVSEVTRDVTAAVASIEGRRHGRSAGMQKAKGRRRVSFDDAKLDETFASERSRSFGLELPRKRSQRGHLAQPSRDGRLAINNNLRRARSISSQRPTSHGLRQPAPKELQQTSPSTIYTSDLDEYANPTLLMEPSETQLDMNADAFATTSAIRMARRCIHQWHDRTLVLLQSHEQAFAIASAHDRRTLLRQALDQWRSHLASRKEAHALELQDRYRDEQATQIYNTGILARAFQHWAQSAIYQRDAVETAKKHMLEYRYFHRWRMIALENVVKARSILVRKYQGLWRERLARRQLRDEQAIAVYEESNVKRCWRAWFWRFCSQRVDGWRDEHLKRRMLHSWRARLQGFREHERRATVLHATHTMRTCVQGLGRSCAVRRQAEQRAAAHYGQTVTRRCLGVLQIRARLEPHARTMTLAVRLNLQRKAFRVWQLHLQLLQQAAEVDRRRVLQSAWTNWNDALRCRALSQKIDERVLVEHLYRWVLQERLRLFRRAVEAGILRQAIAHWRAKVDSTASRLTVAESAFYEAQHRRRLVFGMTKLNLAVRQREDAHRAAVEFATARALPNAVLALQTKIQAVRKLERWARDARFYTLTTRSLRIWKEQTTRHQLQRKREAYAAIRARVKIRLVSNSLTSWRQKTAHVRSMDDEAERRATEKLTSARTRAFNSWHQRTIRVQELDSQATVIDHQRLISSAFSALTYAYVEIQRLEERAQTLRQDIDLATLAGALKRLQWAQFTAARRDESAEALWARNRDTHIRNMIRTWALQTAAKRQRRPDRDEEPESPSLRPASRAASRSRTRAEGRSFPAAAHGSATPVYMRTPSRSRRAGRFRSLPTPAAFTPFAFDTSYLTTIPAPLPGMPPEHGTSAESDNLGALTSQVTPFARKLRAGGFARSRLAPPVLQDEDTVDSGLSGIAGLPATPGPTPALRTSIFGGRSVTFGTAKSVRFAGASRFGSGSSGHLKSS